LQDCWRRSQSQKVSQQSKGAQQKKDENNRQEFVKPKLTDLNIALAFCLPLTEQFTNCAFKRALELCEAIYPPFLFSEILTSDRKFLPGRFKPLQSDLEKKLASYPCSRWWHIRCSPDGRI
jgi:hypothetical protein